MNRNLKFFTLMFVVFITICLACSAVLIVGPQLGIHQFIGSNAVAAQNIAASMLDYTLPSKYQEQGGRDIGFIKMVLFTPDGKAPDFLNQNVILISTVPSILDLSEDQFQRELRLAMLRSASDVSTMEFIREFTTNIQSEDVKLKIYESFGDYDPPTRIIISSAFTGKSENMVVVFAGPIASWDQKIVNQFLGSIR